MAQIIKNFDVAEMHLSFTRGQWDYSRFGEPSHQAPAPGVELMAWIYSNGTQDATQQWQSLTQKLSGMFCATLATASQPKVYVSPKLTFIPTPDTAKSPIKPFYAHLALESACTENLTPWLKLLPCRHYAGVSALLKPHGVFDSHYSSMSLTVVPSCENGKDCLIKTKQRLTVVKPHRLAAQWELSKLFKSKLNHACPLASKSTVSVKSPISAACTVPSAILDPMPVGGCNGPSIYHVSPDSEFELKVDSSPLSPQALFPEELIKIERHMVDRVGLQGAFNITITNLIDRKLDVALLQVLPWFIQPYLHTILFNGQFNDFFFQPALDLQQASALEFKFSIHPRATLSLHIEFDAKFLTLDQYPPDANRGFSIG
ncbi:Subunit of the glycosylphosphatidylinositol transamidase complex-like protein, variant 2 [Entomophthora muscae]|nr:Subunit of the glycosylphosphatidylinositol transamidase complex-like protein, variant 2 [Entomophthora muscae]